MSSDPSPNADLNPKSKKDRGVEAYISKLLKEIDDIEPKKLGSTSYSRYIKQLSEISRTAIEHDSSCLIYILDSIKNSQKPCYKRDVLIEVLNQIVFPPKSIIAQLLCNTFQPNVKTVPWKSLANAIITIPDVVANTNSLKKFPGFQSEDFFSTILVQLYDTIVKIYTRESKLYENQKCFYLQLLGRIAFSGHSQLVWKKFTSKILNEGQVGLRSILSDLITYPLRTDIQTVPQFELFIESLYIPIFFNLKPSRHNGKLIKSLLGDYILKHESFTYIVCNKSIFQTNYKHDRHRQAIILFNIFAYLSSLNDGESDSRKNGGSDLLIKTLLEIGQSWSNSTKILFRSYEQNSYLTKAFIIAFRYALECDKQNLLKKAETIQAIIIQGFPVYLNRATGDLRHLALCIGETVLQALHDLVDENSPKDPQKSKEPLKLNFDIELDDVSLDIKRLFTVDLDEMFHDYSSDIDQEKKLVNSNAQSTSCLAPVAASQSSNDDSQKSSDINSEQPTKNDSAKKIIIELDSDDDDDEDLLPHDLSDDEDCDVDNGEVVCGDDNFMNIPIYLQDCIDGLVENKNPRYVRLCLIKADELTSQLLQQQQQQIIEIDTPEKQISRRLECNKASDLFANDAIRDNAIELAQLLLYLDDQYLIEDFDNLRMKGIISLCVAAPDLVAKYLLDEFNGTHKSTRHQLDILQALVASAKQLSSSGSKKEKGAKSVNKFEKYASLYFYGIVHHLKQQSSDISPASLLSVCAKSRELELDSSIDDSYLLSRIFFSIALIIECVDQQLITCKLSNHLVDILAHYRYNHSDSGVRKAITSCLVAIRDYTPSVYFKEYLHDRIVSLFGDWLALVELDSPL